MGGWSWSRRISSNSNSELELITSFLKLEHQQALSSQIIQCLSNVALFVQVSEGDAFVSRRAFVSEGVAKAAGF